MQDRSAVPSYLIRELAHVLADEIHTEVARETARYEQRLLNLEAQVRVLQAQAVRQRATHVLVTHSA